MNSELKQKWTEALRSGKYIQGQGRLRSSDDRFCCLGVLCDVLDVRWTKNSEDDQYFIVGGGCYYLPGWLQEKAGLEPGKDSELANMNDALVPFASIADYIEKNL